jgi:hypothetical protein
MSLRLIRRLVAWATCSLALVSVLYAPVESRVWREPAPPVGDIFDRVAAASAPATLPPDFFDRAEPGWPFAKYGGAVADPFEQVGGEMVTALTPDSFMGQKSPEYALDSFLAQTSRGQITQIAPFGDIFDRSTCGLTDKIPGWIGTNTLPGEPPKVAGLTPEPITARPIGVQPVRPQGYWERNPWRSARTSRRFLFALLATMSRYGGEIPDWLRMAEEVLLEVAIGGGLLVALRPERENPAG